MRKKNCARWFAVAGILSIGACSPEGDDFSQFIMQAGVTGQVRGPAGAPVSGVQVKTNLAADCLTYRADARFDAVTDTMGRYRIALFTVGPENACTKLIFEPPAQGGLTVDSVIRSDLPFRSRPPYDSAVINIQL